MHHALHCTAELHDESVSILEEFAGAGLYWYSLDRMQPGSQTACFEPETMLRTVDFPLFYLSKSESTADVASPMARE